MVDPVTVIVAALAAGASAGVGDAATSAVKDTYAGLRALVEKRFAGIPAAEVALVEHEKAPDTWEQVLRQQITATGAERDGEIVAAAQALVALVRAGTRLGNASVVVNDQARVGVIGHGDNTITMGDHPPKE